MFKSAGPYLLAIVIFMVISFIYFKPIIEGKDLPQMDNIHAQGMAKELVDFEKNTGEVSMWTNSMFGGMPAYQIKGGPTYNIFSYAFHVARLAFLPYSTVSILFLYLLGFYILLLSLKVDKWLSIFGAVAFALASYNIIIIGAGHITKAYAMGVMAPVIGGVLLTYRGKYVLGGLVTLVFLGIEIATNHVQIAFYLGLTILVLVAVQFVYALREKTMNKFIKASAIIAVAAVLAIAPATTMLWTTYEYSKESIRGEAEITNNKGVKPTSGLDKDYALAWSYGKKETLTLMIPNAVGGASNQIGDDKELLSQVDQQFQQVIAQQNQYWGDQPFTSGPVYVGAIICFLFVLGFFYVNGAVKWWIVGATLLSVCLAWGKNLEWFTDLFFYYFPMYNKFRTVAMTLVIAGLTMPLLAFLALMEVIRHPDLIKKRAKEFFIALGLTGGVCLIFWLVPTIFSYITVEELKAVEQAKLKDPNNALQYDAILKNLEAVRILIFKSDAIRSFFFIILSAGAIWLYSRRVVGKYILISAVGILILVDMWQIDKRYLGDNQFTEKKVSKETFQPTKADQFILKDTDPNFRVLNLSRNPFTEVNTSYFHKSLGGYHGAKLRRLQDGIDRYVTTDSMQSMLKQITAPSGPVNHMAYQTFVNMMNTKYIIVNPEMPPHYNNFALGNTWFTDTIVWAKNANEELKAIGEYNPAVVAVIDEKFKPALADFKFASRDSSNRRLAKLIEYKPNKLTYQFNCKHKQLAVFSEVFYDKGWTATINNKPAEIIRVNYLLRGLVIPEGPKLVVFKFEPNSYFVGQKITLAADFLIAILVIFVLVKMFIDTKKGIDSPFAYTCDPEEETEQPVAATVAEPVASVKKKKKK